MLGTFTLSRRTAPVSAVTVNHFTCAHCGQDYKRIEGSRPSHYCGRPCQSRAAATRTNARRGPTGNAPGRPRSAQATHIAGDAIRVSQPQQICVVQTPRYASFGLRASPRFKGETLDWIACNDVTRKAIIVRKNANANALGFVLKIESTSLHSTRSVPAHDDGCWGRVKDVIH